MGARAACLAHVTVGMMPYAINEFNLGRSPLKLIEYLAAGLPVVSTRLRLDEALVPYVLVGAAASEFADQARRAVLMAGDCDRRTRQVQLIRDEYRWDRRATALGLALEQAISRRRWRDRRRMAGPPPDSPARQTPTIMHSAQVADGVVPSEGGLSTHVETLALGLAEVGHQATVVSARTRHDLGYRLSFELGCLLHRYGGFTGRLQKFLLEARRSAQELSADLALLYAQQRCDVVNYHGVPAMRAAARVRRHGPPEVLTVHDYLAAGFVGVGVVRKGSAWERRFLQWEREAFETAQQVVCVDTRLGRHVEALTDGRVTPHIIHNCVHPAFLDLGKRREPAGAGRDFVILCPRRLTPKNGVVYAVEMARVLRDRGLDCSLRLAGSGEERRMLEERVAECGLGDRVTMLGPIGRAQMIAEMSSCSAVVVPSVTHEGVEEATSISVMEGMAAGLPVIGSRIGGIAELITDGANGILVEQKSPEALADAVAALAPASDRGYELGMAAHRHAIAMFSHTAHARRLLAVYQACLKWPQLCEPTP